MDFLQHDEMVQLIILSAPSGTGKTTVYHQALAQIPNMKLSVSCTTREPRAGEVDGVDYFFINEEKFQKMIDNNDFLEWAKVYDNYYGTSKHFVQEILDSGNHVLLDIDVQGAMNIKKNTEISSPIFIFLAPPSMEILEKRLRHRGTETEKSLTKRLQNASHEMSFQPQYDYVIVNDDLEQTVKAFVDLINKIK